MSKAGGEAVRKSCVLRNAFPRKLPSQNAAAESHLKLEGPFSVSAYRSAAGRKAVGEEVQHLLARCPGRHGCCRWPPACRGCQAGREISSFLSTIISGSSLLKRLFILYGNTPENCPKLEGLQRGDESRLRRDESRGMRSRGEFPFGQAGNVRLASSGGCPCVSPGRPPWDVGGGNAASQ